jgi:gluconolactonase
MNYREIATGLLVPEGPVALPDGSVLVVEILAGRLTRVYPNGEKTVVAHTGGGPNGAALGPDGRCYICNNGGIPLIERDGKRAPNPDPSAWAPGYIQRIDLDSGTVATLYTSTTAPPARRAQRSRVRCAWRFLVH